MEHIHCEFFYSKCCLKKNCCQIPLFQASHLLLSFSTWMKLTDKIWQCHSLRTPAIAFREHRRLCKNKITIELEKYAKMSELVWGIKNGDIDQVKQIIENKVRCSWYLVIAAIVIFVVDRLWNFQISWEEKAFIRQHKFLSF